MIETVSPLSAIHIPSEEFLYSLLSKSGGCGLSFFPSSIEISVTVAPSSIQSPFLDRVEKKVGADGTYPPPTKIGLWKFSVLDLMLHTDRKGAPKRSGF